MKYPVEQEKELMTNIWSLNVKNALGDKRTPPSSISQDQGSGKKKFCEKLQHKYKGTTAK
jgi:hypothetical protein